jgi:hypothetical protein
MGRSDTEWGEWSIVPNSRGFTSPVFSGAGCLAKFGDELRQSRFQSGNWDAFVSVGGGRFMSDPVVLGIQVYGVGMEGQLFRNEWHSSDSAWKGWEDLGSPAGEILGTPAVARGGPAGNRYVVVKGGDNRLYLRVFDNEGGEWADWEQGDKLGAGQFTGDPSIFTIMHDGQSELVLTGRSLESEMATISRKIGIIGPIEDPDSLWSEWSVVEGSRGYSSPKFAMDPEDDVVHCLVKVGDEVRHARYLDGRWDGFESVGGGRFKSDPIVVVGEDNDSLEVYGIGLDGQVARNLWPSLEGSWQGWQNLGHPEPGVVGTPSVETDFHDRFVVAKGGNNRLYLRYSSDGEIWEPWEQAETLGQGIVRGDVSTFVVGPKLVVTGRSLEDEMASISLTLQSRG